MIWSDLANWLSIKYKINEIIRLFSVPLGSIPELPAETCLEIKKSEGHAISRKYWFSSIKTGTSVLAYCDMKTEGEF